MRMRNIIVGIAVSVALLSLIGARAIGAQTEADARAGDDVSGKIIFARHCAGCHGPQGVGDGYMMLGPDPANLTSPSTTHKSDAILLRTIHEESPTCRPGSRSCQKNRVERCWLTSGRLGSRQGFPTSCPMCSEVDPKATRRRRFTLHLTHLSPDNCVEG